VNDIKLALVQLFQKVWKQILRAYPQGEGDSAALEPGYQLQQPDGIADLVEPEIQEGEISAGQPGRLQEGLIARAGDGYAYCSFFGAAFISIHPLAFRPPGLHPHQAGLHILQADLVQVKAIQEQQARSIAEFRVILGRNDCNGIVDMQITYFKHRCIMHSLKISAFR